MFVSDADPTEARPAKLKPVLNGCFYSVCLFGILAVLFSLGPGRMSGIRYNAHNAVMQQARQVGQLMFSYAVDNTVNGNVYPDGNSSTEVFQKLIDAGYCTDPSIFYIPMAGKTPGLPGQKLKPENVCWDVTEGVDGNSSDYVPQIFMTGYKMTYAAGGSAVPIIKPYPPYWPRTWGQFFVGGSGPSPVLALFYKRNFATYIHLDPDNTIHNAVPPDYKPDGHTYRQLTPDGVLQ